MIVRLPVPLPPGAYVVHWHAMSDEGLHTGHITEGEFSFWIQDGAGALRPGWVLAGLGLLGGLAGAFVILRASSWRIRGQQAANYNRTGRWGKGDEILAAAP